MERYNVIQKRHWTIIRIAEAVLHKLMSHVLKGRSVRPVWKSLFMTIVWSLDSFNPVQRNDSDNCWRSWLPGDPIRMLPCIKIWAARWIWPQKVTSVNWSRRPIRDCPVALLLLNICKLEAQRNVNNELSISQIEMIWKFGI